MSCSEIQLFKEITRHDESSRTSCGLFRDITRILSTDSRFGRLSTTSSVSSVASSDSGSLSTASAAHRTLRPRSPLTPFWITVTSSSCRGSCGGGGSDRSGLTGWDRSVSD